MNKRLTLKELICDAAVLAGVALAAIGISKTSVAGAWVFVGLSIIFIAINVATK